MRERIECGASAPWALIKRGMVELAGQLLRTQVETLQVIAQELAPILPRTAATLSRTLNSPQLPPSLNLFSRWVEPC